MVRNKGIIVTIVFSLLFWSGMAQQFGGHPSSLKWMQINSNTARVIFPAGLDSQANRIASIVQLLDSATVSTIGGKIRKWNIILLNQGTVSNAYVRLAPVLSELYLTPPQDNFSEGSIRWDDNLIIHENRHMQQFSNFNKGLTRLFSFFLGQQGQLLANGITLPNYFFEGDAVWQETLVSAQGRGRMPSFYTGFKSLWMANKDYSWMMLRNGSYRKFVPDHYPLGYMLVAYGYEQYGEKFWAQVTNDAVRFKGLFYSFPKAIERYSGKTYRQYREDAVKFFREQSIPAVEASLKDTLSYITPVQKNNVIDYTVPNSLGMDTILTSRKSYKRVDGFYLLVNGHEEKIKMKDVVLDDYYSYNNGKIVYAAYRSDPRWGNRDYSVIKVLDIHSHQERQLTQRSKYYSPDINTSGTEILAVNVDPNGTNTLHRLDAQSGRLILKLPNPHNYFYTQTKYIGSNNAVSAVRTPEGKMGLVNVDLTTGESERITPFTFNVMGYPFVKGDTIYFSLMNNNADKVFAVRMSDKKIFRLTHNINSIYRPSVNKNNELLVDAFTSDGSRLAKIKITQADWAEIPFEEFDNTPDLYTRNALRKAGAGILYTLPNISMGDAKKNVSKYKKSFHLFNFHSARPVISDPEYSYIFYSDNILSTFTSNLTYTYNRNEYSHTVGFNGIFGGWFPVLNGGVEESFNRQVDTAIGKSFQFNSAKAHAGVSIPLSFAGGKTSKYFNFGGAYNIEQVYYRGISKNVFQNDAIDYISSFFSFANISQQARQHINPHWAQNLLLTYRKANTYRDSHKFVGTSSLYFPGLSSNHSIVLNGALQKRDSLPDLFSNNFPYSRGYGALSTRRMYKLGANYHLPLLYPDWGFGNMIFFQRIRANAFYDYTSARARLSGVLTDIISRSTGGELYFDTKIWNELPVTIGVRFSHLLDIDLVNPTVRNKWEIILPVGIIPN